MTETTLWTCFYCSLQLHHWHHSLRTWERSFIAMYCSTIHLFCTNAFVVTAAMSLFMSQFSSPDECLCHCNAATQIFHFRNWLSTARAFLLSKMNIWINNRNICRICIRWLQQGRLPQHDCHARQWPFGKTWLGRVQKPMARHSNVEGIYRIRNCIISKTVALTYSNIILKNRTRSRCTIEIIVPPWALWSFVLPFTLPVTAWTTMYWTHWSCVMAIAKEQ